MRLACGRTPDTLTAVVARAARTWVTCSNAVHMHASLRNVVGNRRYARLLARRRVLQHPLPERLRLRPWLCALPGAVSLPAALLVEGGARELLLTSRSDRVVAGSEGDWAWLASCGADVRRFAMS